MNSNGVIFENSAAPPLRLICTDTGCQFIGGLYKHIEILTVGEEAYVGRFLHGRWTTKTLPCPGCRTGIPLIRIDQTINNNRDSNSRNLRWPSLCIRWYG